MGQWWNLHLQNYNGQSITKSWAETRALTLIVKAGDIINEADANLYGV